MATIAESVVQPEQRPDRLSGTPRAHALDRWIYALTAASFIAIVLAGFIPNSLEQIEAIRAGRRAPFPLVTHMHAVLMGAFLLLLLAQTALVASGRTALHRKLGLASLLLAPAIIVVGFLLVPTNYYAAWGAAQAAPAAARLQLDQRLLFLDNIMLLQIRSGLLFALFLAIGLMAQSRNAGLHKRMMILAVAVPLGAGIVRIPWLPNTMPASPLGLDLYILLAVSPLFSWDVIRNRYLHRAWQIWLGIFLAAAIPVHALWDTPWWHATARAIMGV